MSDADQLDTGEIELDIESLAAGGEGVGRLPDGRVAFVPFTAVGDRVVVRVVEERARFVRAVWVAIRRRGVGRTTPGCPHYGRCGGCSWQHLDYATQLVAKEGILAESLMRIGGIEPAEPIRVVPSPRPYGYRGRTRVHVQNGRVGYRERRSTVVAPVSTCPVLVEPLVEELEALGKSLTEKRPGSKGKSRERRRSRMASVEWELAVGTSGVPRVQRLPAQGGPSVRIRVREDFLEFSPGVFAQSNLFLLDELVEAVDSAVGRGSNALELYAGAGLFTLGLARRFQRVMAVEANRNAVRDLGVNLTAAGIDNVEIACARVESIASSLPIPPAGYEVVFVDPPRSGLPKSSVDWIHGFCRPRRLVYLSCNPATLARDLSRFVELDYEVGRVRGFDLFPQTPHVEALAVLERPGE
ncbi:TRAM domain-containing protein [Myxococcota bacterium]|nr:TRAM domain-containing protein [Myxococcota bacterium]